MRHGHWGLDAAHNMQAQSLGELGRTPHCPLHGLTDASMCLGLCAARVLRAPCVGLEPPLSTSLFLSLPHPAPGVTMVSCPTRPCTIKWWGNKRRAQTYRDTYALTHTHTHGIPTIWRKG